MFFGLDGMTFAPRHGLKKNYSSRKIINLIFYLENELVPSRVWGLGDS